MSQRHVEYIRRRYIQLRAEIDSIQTLLEGDEDLPYTRDYWIQRRRALITEAKAIDSGNLLGDSDTPDPRQAQYPNRNAKPL